MNDDARKQATGWLGVYVPRPGTELREQIATGSGVVGSPADQDGHVRIDYEGNLHDIGELERYAERVKRAAERHKWEGPDGEAYPTSARARVQNEKVIRIGRVDLLTRTLEVDNRDALADWLEVGTVPEMELTFTDTRDHGWVLCQTLCQNRR